MKKNILRNVFVALAGLVLFVPMAAFAGAVNSNLATVPLAYSGPEGINVTATVNGGSPTVTFPSGGGQASGTIQIQTAYSLNPGRVITVEAGFASPIALANLTGGPSIGVGYISGAFSSLSGGTVTSYNNCNNTAFTSQMSWSCGYVTYSPIFEETTGTYIDTLTLSMSSNASAAPGSYAGTLVVAAQAN